MRRRKKTYLNIRVILATDEVSVDGQHAFVDTADGLAYATPSAATMIAMGRFAEAKTGDGTETVLIRLYDEAKIDNWLNDTAPNNVTIANLWGSVYAKSGTTVSTSDGGGARPVAGRVVAIENGEIYVQSGLTTIGPSGLGTNLSSGVADKDALSALIAAVRFDGMQVMVRADGSMWRFVAASTATEDEGQELVIQPDAGSGRWLANDKHKTLKLPVAYTMADGDAVLTVPAGFVLRLAGLPYWEVTTDWTGGTASTIGVSTSVTGYETKGDILGGAAGDAAAGLTAGIQAGTLGGELDDNVGFQALALVEGDELQYDEITSAFTAGTGFVRVPVAIATV